MQASTKLTDFLPIELCNLEYVPDRGSSIDPHFDDFWVWGERLVTLNLLSETILSFSNDNFSQVRVDVSMPPRSLIVVYGDARYKWKHALHRDCVQSRRIACTFRELTPEFMSGQKKDIGRELLDIALSYNGKAVASLS